MTQRLQTQTTIGASRGSLFFTFTSNRRVAPHLFLFGQTGSAKPVRGFASGSFSLSALVALGDYAVGEAGYVVGHYQEIAGAAAAVFDPIGEYGFDLEAEVIEGGACGGLIGGHLGGDLF
jgi:hypothetical protein